MGILNVTPDSFSDGGQFLSPCVAVAHAFQMLADGADIIDVGGESTRPGSQLVSTDDELNRVIPVIRSIRKESDCWISIDTTKSEVAARAIEEGANIVNDVSGLTADSGMASLVAKTGSTVCIMHMRGTPDNMQSKTEYSDLIGEISGELSRRIDIALSAGILKENIIVDPGIGFAKTGSQNLEILRRLSEFQSLGYPILVGTSRKRFIKELVEDQPTPRIDFGTAATVALAIQNGAKIVRVHDVSQMKQVCLVADEIVDHKADL
ncbi:MAG: dihydropteroate synthase [Chthonomonadales bacterium]